MSKIAELLKLAEKKKEDTKLELPSPVILQPEVDVSKNSPEQVSISKNRKDYVEVSVSKQDYDGVSRTRGKQVELGVTKSNVAGVSVSRSNSNSKSNDNSNYINPRSVETSPSKDYTKVSNSIMKRAIPEKYFRGLSKHTYDVLYQRTRGAIVPTRTIQLTKDELVRLTGISKDAIKLHIKYLKETGLLKSRPAIGSHAGWEYEILVPEEIEDTGQVGVRQDKAMQGNASENLPLHSGQNLPPLTYTNLIEDKDTYEFSKTSLKTNTKNDDENARISETFSDMNKRLDSAVKKITGKEVSKTEAGKWSNLADLLILELEIAASRADGISSVPAFLTEVLRRQFFTSREKQSFTKTTKSSKPKTDTVGKPESGTYQIKPLDEKEREEAVNQLREFAEEDFLPDFKKWYTAEDWEWIMHKLRASDKK